LEDSELTDIQKRDGQTETPESCNEKDENLSTADTSGKSKDSAGMTNEGFENADFPKDCESTDTQQKADLIETTESGNEKDINLSRNTNHDEVNDAPKKESDLIETPSGVSGNEKDVNLSTPDTSSCTESEGDKTTVGEEDEEVTNTKRKESNLIETTGNGNYKYENLSTTETSVYLTDTIEYKGDRNVDHQTNDEVTDTQKKEFNLIETPVSGNEKFVNLSTADGLYTTSEDNNGYLLKDNEVTDSQRKESDLSGNKKDVSLSTADTSDDTTCTTSENDKKGGELTNTQKNANEIETQGSCNEKVINSSNDDTSKTLDDASKTLDDASKTLDDASKTLDDASKTLDGASDISSTSINEGTKELDQVKNQDNDNEKGVNISISGASETIDDTTGTGNTCIDSEDSYQNVSKYGKSTEVQKKESSDIERLEDDDQKDVTLQEHYVSKKNLPISVTDENRLERSINKAEHEIENNELENERIKEYITKAQCITEKTCSEDKMVVEVLSGEDFHPRTQESESCVMEWETSYNKDELTNISNMNKVNFF